MRTMYSFWREALLTLLFFTGVSQFFHAHAQSSDNQPPTVCVAEPHNGAAFAAGADITLWATASDSDGWLKTVEFFANGTSLGITTNNPLVMSPINPFHLTWQNVAAGEYALTASATDNGGASAVSDPVQIKVMDANIIPVVTIRVTDNIAREQSPLVDAAPDLARFVVHRTCNLNDKLVVHYRVSGTAENGVDYVKLSGEVGIPVGSATAEIMVNALDDQRVEA